MMNIELKKELLSHVIDELENIISYENDFDLSELHHRAFNEDYYIIGYYEANQWLKKHDIDCFDEYDLNRMTYDYVRGSDSGLGCYFKKPKIKFNLKKELIKWTNIQAHLRVLTIH